MKIFPLLIFLSFSSDELRLEHRTSFVVYPEHCNHNYPMLFGGKVLAEMDKCAGITARRLLYSSTVRDAVTVKIDNLVFHKGGQLKDLVFVTGKVVELGEKSIKIHVVVTREIAGRAEHEWLADGIFTFVAYDLETKKAVPHGLKLK